MQTSHVSSPEQGLLLFTITSSVLCHSSYDKRYYPHTRSLVNMGIIFLNKLYLINVVAQSKPERLLGLVYRGNNEIASNREQETEHWSEWRQNMKALLLLAFFGL